MVEDDKSFGEAKRRFREFTKETEEAAKKITKEVRDVADTVTGKKVENLVIEFSELYTQVALGLHQDLVAQEEDIKDIQNNREKDIDILNGVGRRLGELENIAQELEGLRVAVKKVETVKYIALSALIVSVFTMAGMLWIAI